MSAARYSCIVILIPVCFILVILYRLNISLSVHEAGINTPANFPDPAFRRAVEHYMDVRPGEPITACQAAAMTGIFDCDNREIHKIEGLHYFSNISGFWCANNKIERLDVSRNPMLQQIDCSNNKINELRLPVDGRLRELHCFRNQLSQLDVSRCDSLVLLRCDFNQLAVLDLTSNRNLTLIGCSNNRLSDLNLFWNEKLQHLFCGNNQLATLDVSHTPVLTVLRCSGNNLKELFLPNPSRIEILDWNVKHSLPLPALLTLKSFNSLETNGAG